jgi:hypothetical protein
LDKQGEEAKELDQFLQLNNDSAEYQLFVIAYNNGLDFKNSKRVEIVKAGLYVDGFNVKTATEFV